MELTLLKLINNEEEILEYYKNAEKLWEKIWNSKESQNEKELADLITSYQFYFEDQCGGRDIGQEIMVWSGYAYLIKKTEAKPETNSELNKFINAFDKSHVSSEIYGDLKNLKKLISS